MNIQEHYQAAIQGSLTTDPQGNPLVTAALKPLGPSLVEIQEHEAWLNHPQTRAFISYLEKSAQEILEVASIAALSAEEDLSIRILMVQHNKLIEIINYARRTTNS
jgi:hypothetical protein